MEQLRFEDLPNEVLLLRQEIAELKAIVSGKLAPVESKVDRTMSVQEAAEYMRCSVANVHKKKNNGQIPYFQSGKKVFFKQSEIDKVMAVKPRKSKFFK